MEESLKEGSDIRGYKWYKVWGGVSRGGVCEKGPCLGTELQANSSAFLISGPSASPSPPNFPGPSLSSQPSLKCLLKSTPAPLKGPAQLHPPSPPTPSITSLKTPLPSMPWAGAALGRPLAIFIPRWTWRSLQGVRTRRLSASARPYANVGPGLSPEAR